MRRARRRERQIGELGSPRKVAVVEPPRAGAVEGDGTDQRVRIKQPVDRIRPLGGPDFATHPRQRTIEVTEAVTITGETFEFVQDYRGLEVLPQKGTLIGRDNGREVRTPYDDCVLIMPSRRLVKGQTAVRLGRYVT